jgi:NTE family protein
MTPYRGAIGVPEESAMKINAVFEGGGIKGISLTGAVFALEKRGFEFHHLAGTSSGAIVASLLAAGYRAEELRRLIETTPFTLFLKRSPLFDIRIVGPAVRLLYKKGLYSGEALEYWVKGLLGRKGIRTFGDMPPGKLNIVASDISNGKLLVLPDDLAYYDIDPNQFEVAKAVRMSASIPYFFDPVLIRQKSNGRPLRNDLKGRFAYIVDGALLSNFPLWLFDHEQTGRTVQIPTIGFRMVGKNRNEPRKIRGPFTMLEAIFETMISAHDERYIEKTNRDRTIKIPTLGVRTTQFELTVDMSRRLFESGQEAAEEFLRTFKP